METTMTIDVPTRETLESWNKSDKIKYLDSYGVPPKTVAVTVRGTYEQLGEYGTPDLSRSQVRDCLSLQEKVLIANSLLGKGQVADSEMSLEELASIVTIARDYETALKINDQIEYLEHALRPSNHNFLGRESKRCSIDPHDIMRAENLRDIKPSLFARVSDAYKARLEEETKDKQFEEQMKEQKNREVAERRQRIEQFLSDHTKKLDDEGMFEIANQFRDGLLSEDDLRKFARVILFAPLKKFDRYVPLDKDDCPECSDGCYRREVEFFAKDADTLPPELYPVYVDFTSSVASKLPSATCTPRYHQVTCGRCDADVWPKYSVLVSLNWEGFDLSREYDPFSTQQ